MIEILLVIGAGYVCWWLLQPREAPPAKPQRKSYATIYENGEYTDLNAKDVTALLKPFRDQVATHRRQAKAAEKKSREIFAGKYSIVLAIAEFEPMLEQSEREETLYERYIDKMFMNTDKGNDRIFALLNQFMDASCDLRSEIEHWKSLTAEDIIEMELIA